MFSKTITIATRQSPLALWQAQFVKEALEAHYPFLTINLLPLLTSGDLKLGAVDTPFSKDLFVKELESALLDKRADLAVHSMKDVPAIFPEGLALAAICRRGDPRDAFVSETYDNFFDLPEGARIGTSSLRRCSQLKSLRMDLEILPLRGNINTRLNKLHAGEFDAIILAAVGLARLQLEEHLKHCFSTTQFLPAAGQGALGIECRSDDHELIKLVEVLSDPMTHACVTAERAMTSELGGNCDVPIAAFCEWDDDENVLSLRGLVGTPEGDIILHGAAKGPLNLPQNLGNTVAQILCNEGAMEVLSPR